MNVLRARCRWLDRALPEEAAKCADHVRRRLVVKTGLTGMWQVSGWSDLPWDESVASPKSAIRR